jgi:hypothetical protein
MKVLVSLLALVTLGVAAPAPQSSAIPPLNQVEIQYVTYGGTGCPERTVQGLLSNDRTTLTLSFDAYTVQSGPDIPASERRKFCQLQLKLRYPGGFQYSIFGADYRGYASLESGVTGTAQSTYYFSGQQNQVRLPRTLLAQGDSKILTLGGLTAVFRLSSPQPLPAQ